MSWPILLAAGVTQEFGPEKSVEAAIEGGWDSVGLWIEPDEWTHATTKGVLSRAHDGGLRIEDVEVIRIMPGAFDDRILASVDVGLAVGAQNIIVISFDPDPHATAEKIARLQRHAGKNLSVTLEYIPFTEVKTIDQAVSILKEAGGGTQIMIDPLHMSRSGGSPSDIARVPKEMMRYVQICDVGALTYDPKTDLIANRHEARELRLPCGEGTLPLTEFMSYIPDGMTLSVELRSHFLRDDYPDPFERAKALADSTRAWLKGLGGGPQPKSTSRAIRH